MERVDTAAALLAEAGFVIFNERLGIAKRYLAVSYDQLNYAGQHIHENKLQFSLFP